MEGKALFNFPKQTGKEWEIINPEGVRRQEAVKLNPHPVTLEGKTVVLTWNNKPNGDVLLNRLAELLAKEVKDVKIIKLWELKPFTAVISHDPEVSKQIAAAISAYKPDLVINAQGD